MKLTKQGVRDLGNNYKQRRPEGLLKACSHIWQSEREYDCMGGYTQWVQKCVACDERRY